MPIYIPLYILPPSYPVPTHICYPTPTSIYPSSRREWFRSFVNEPPGHKRINMPYYTLPRLIAAKLYTGVADCKQVDRPPMFPKTCTRVNVASGGVQVYTRFTASLAPVPDSEHTRATTRPVHPTRDRQQVCVSGKQEKEGAAWARFVALGTSLLHDRLTVFLLAPEKARACLAVPTSASSVAMVLEWGRGFASVYRSDGRAIAPAA
ncbi:hypothetical protein DFH07DRAFT_954606 [Mycena maculata]|uniref:Uncharacterized protein n=1 Tax=Mycena maculata TaxID=230809 RepID=A0AAD7JP39_9AGAR|nr:hypothetical protein DFH07DRAFT_954606 [Mycena maculata]